MALPEPLTADGQKIPSKLKLAFSQAADNSRIRHIFTPGIKSQIDPHNYVVKREKAIFDATIARGGGAFLYDTATGEVHTLTMAYHVEDKANNDPHAHTEIGSSLARITGFKSAQVVVAALVLKEWWHHQPSGIITTEILPENTPSLAVYRDTMGWQSVTDPGELAEIERLCNENIEPEDKNRPALWFCCTSSVLPKLAQILLTHMDRGSLTNKHTGQQIALDLTALEQAGLTRPRLEAIARGITDKRQLAAMNPVAAPHHSP